MRLKSSAYNHRHKTSRGVRIRNTLYNSMARFLSVNMTTTLKCNAQCAYCYKHGVTQVDFDERKLEALTSFIKRRKRKMPVALNWFRGEPLLNPKVIDYVTDHLVEQGIEFNSYMITNGSLLTRRLIKKKFPQWRMRGIQITLDGTEHAYEARKDYVGSGRHMFKRVLDRIEWAASSGVMIDIRLNIDRDNIADVLGAFAVPIIVVDTGDEGAFMIVQRISSRKIFVNDSIGGGVFQRRKNFFRKGLDKRILDWYHTQVV